MSVKSNDNKQAKHTGRWVVGNRSWSVKYLFMDLFNSLLLLLLFACSFFLCLCLLVCMIAWMDVRSDFLFVDVLFPVNPLP